MRRLLAGCAALVFVLVGHAAAAQNASFPDRPIRLVIPYAPGGATDATIRLLAGPMGEILGQPFVIENRTGARAPSARRSSRRRGRTGTRCWPTLRRTR